MSGDIQARLYGWIDRQIDGAAARGGLRELVLNHLNASDQLQEIARYAITDDNASEIKSELYRTALDVVASWKHFQRFAVQAHFTESTTVPYYPFSLADDTPETGPQATEPANLVGALKQQMRHNEILAKINAGIMAEANQLLLNQSKQAHAALDELRVRFSDLLEKSHEALGKRQAEEFEHQRLLAADARKEKLTESVQTAVPLIVNRVSEHLGGPKLLPEGRSPMELMMIRLLKNLTDEGLEGLMAAFPNPAEQAIVLDLVRTYCRPEKPSNGSH
jgi:ElaB/YqjD/DUF883 family membrane-anchored ribosome-binding protein